MSWLTDLILNGPSDPLALAGVVILVWLPLCAVALSVLWLLAYVQERLTRRRPRRPAIVVPPSEVRPLAARRYVSSGPRPGSVGAAVSTARVTVVVVVVAAFTAYLLVTNASTLLGTLSSAG